MIVSRVTRPALFVLMFLLAGVMRAQPSHTTWLLLNVPAAEALLVSDPGEQARLAKAGWKTNGTGALADATGPDLVAVHRLFRPDPAGNDHMVATNPEVLAEATKAGYTDEGVLGYATKTRVTPDMIPVYRFVKGSRHLCLISKDDLPWATKNGWKSEGVDFWIWPAKSS